MTEEEKIMANKILLFVFLFLLKSTLSAQASKFTLKVESNIGLSDRMFVNDGSVPEVIEDLWSNIEKPKIGYELGLLIAYNLTDRWSLQSGLRYADWGYKTDKTALYTDFPNPLFPDFTETKSQNRYLELPIRINYYFRSGTNQVYIWGGYSPSYNLTNTIITKSYFSDETVTSKMEDTPFNYSYRKINMVGELGVGLQRMISNKIGLTIGPNLRTQSFGIVKDAPLNRILFFYGLSVGLNFK
jgi:hypothetical protein